jgi:hypothetical protein
MKYLARVIRCHERNRWHMLRDKKADHFGVDGSSVA